MTTDRRPATATDITVGAIVYKGQGKVAYRVWGVREDGSCSVVKATTPTDPTRGSWYRLAELTVDAAL